MKTKYLQNFLYLYFLITAIAMAYIYGIVVKANGDNVEHLHSSWLVWQGYIPYKDFFQHHNPLLWYVFAPLVALLINNITIFSVFNIFSLLFLCIAIYYQAKTLILNNTSLVASLFLCTIEISSYSIVWAMGFRPDTYMYLFLFAGLFYMFKYNNTMNVKDLVICFSCFFIGFMFTQKIILNLIFPACFILYWLISSRISVKNFLFACLLPLVLFSFWAIYLYHHDILKLYWDANFKFNMYIPDIFSQQRIIFPPLEFFEFRIFIPIGSIAAIYFLYKGTAVERLFSLLFVEEAILRLFYFSAFLHYSIFWLITGVTISIMFLDKLKKHRAILGIIGVIYLIFCWWYNYAYTYKVEIKTHNSAYSHEYAFSNLTPCDYALNGYYTTYNLKAKDAGYYWVLLGQIDVLGEKTGIAHRDNLNALIREKKPKLVSSGVYWDTYWEQRGKTIPAHTIDPVLLDLYYDHSGFSDIFILKKQYQKHNCQYNGKSWEYVD